MIHVKVITVLFL